MLFTLLNCGIHRQPLGRQWRWLSIGGYIDYEWFADLSEQGGFVTRMKDNADYVVIEDRELTMLLIKYLQLRATLGWSLSNLVALLCQQLSVYRDLWTWIDCPFQTPPPLEATAQQLPLGLKYPPFAQHYPKGY